MNTKLTKVLLIAITAAAVLASLTYFTRTALDIGCANTGTSEDEQLKRHFLGINCWLWEGTLQLHRDL